MDTPELDIVLPVHNEGATIRSTLDEWWRELSPRVKLRFVVCEDGSTDNTKAVLRDSSKDLPMELLLAEGRKGYSRAVRDGFQATSAPYVLAVDSDGQCDPADFWAFWDRREQADIVLGYRVDRADPTIRKVLSRTFRLWYRGLLGVPFRDPSCPYLLIRRRVLERLLPELGVLEQGFWWEFVARSYRRGFRIIEQPVHHRERKAGQTQVYRWRRMPRIGIAHGLGLMKIWQQTR